MNAYQFHFPEIELVGCFFHYGQAIYRKIKNELKLASEYKADENLQRYVKSVISLALVPPSKVEDAFLNLMYKEIDLIEQYTLGPFNDYFCETWIENDTWLISLWNQYDRTIRTNNHIEGMKKCVGYS